MKRKTLIKHYKAIIIDVISSIFKKNSSGRHNKFNTGFYIDYICRILFLENFGTHFIAHYVIDQLLEKNSIYGETKMFSKLLTKLCQKNIIKIELFKKLYIDSSVIQNINGCDNKIDYYYKIVSKKQTKLHVIIDSNETPISFELSNPKIHDVKMGKKLINNLNVNLKFVNMYYGW